MRRYDCYPFETNFNVKNEPEDLAMAKPSHKVKKANHGKRRKLMSPDFKSLLLGCMDSGEFNDL